jgi:hypothetical protein
MICSPHPLIHLVESDERSSTFLCSVLRLPGFFVTVSSDREQAIQLLPQSRPAVLVCALPRVADDVEDFLNRSAAASAGTRVLLWTERLWPGGGESFLSRAGVRFFLATRHPVDLLAAIRRALQTTQENLP